MLSRKLYLNREIKAVETTLFININLLSACRQYLLSVLNFSLPNSKEFQLNKRANEDFLLWQIHKTFKFQLCWHDSQYKLLWITIFITATMNFFLLVSNMKKINHVVRKHMQRVFDVTWTKFSFIYFHKTSTNKKFT